MSDSIIMRRGRSGSASHGQAEQRSYLQGKHGSNSRTTDSALCTALRSFDSRWFMIPQGTGVLAVVLWDLPYDFHGLKIIAIIFWVVTIVEFLVVLILYIVRATTFPTYFFSLLSTDNTEISCLASIVVTFTSVIQMLGPLLGNSGWGVAVYALWCVCASGATIVVVIIPYVFAHINPPSIAHLLPNTQLPLVAALTAAAAGGGICSGGFLNAELQVPMILVSYLLVGVAVPMALILDALFLGRLYNETKDGKSEESKADALSLAYQTLVLAGPWGQGSSALQSLGGSVMNASFSQYDSGIMLTSQAAPVVGYSSIFVGLVFWGQATFWWAFTLLSVAQAVFINTNKRGKANFSLAAWSMVFPWVCVALLMTKCVC